jgi:glycosyltransferase involved in cell wall biosynthesis
MNFLRNFPFNAKPLVSVVVASYNHQAYVQDCLQSVLNQDFQDFEILVTDDGSTDQTVANIESSVNGIITQETGSILQEFKNNFETIESKFSELKESIEEQGNKVIASLKNEIRAKDEQLRSLVEGKN